MAADKILDPDTPLRAKVVAWLVDQGVSTVLLFSISATLVYAAMEGVPYVLEQINEGYHHNAAELKEVAESFNAALELNRTAAQELVREMQTDHIRERHLFVQLLKRSNMSSEEVEAAIESAEEAAQEDIDDNERMRLPEPHS